MSVKTDLFKSTEKEVVTAETTQTESTVNVTGQSKHTNIASNKSSNKSKTQVRGSCATDELSYVWGLAPAYRMAAYMPRQGHRCYRGA